MESNEANRRLALEGLLKEDLIAITIKLESLLRQIL